MKRIIALVLSLVMALSLCAPAWATMPSEGGALAASEITLKGTGSETDPYVVSTAAELKEAVAKGGNVKLGTDITLTKDTHNMTTSSVCQMVENEVTIDLNGNNITSPDVVFYVLAGGKLTINGDGNLISGNGGSGATVNVYAYGGEVIINGGTYSLNRSYTNDHGADMIYANNRGKITINGGYFNYVENVWTLNLKDNTDSSIVVKGGTFKAFNPAKNVSEGANTNFVAEGYQVTESNNEYVVSKIPAVAKVDGTEYTDLQDAVDVGGTVTLLGPVDLEKRVEIKNDVVIEGNGNTISGADAVVFNICKGVTVTLNNTNIEGKQNGVQMGYSESGTTGSSLTVNGGEITVAKAGILSYGNGNTANKIVLDGVELNSFYWGVYHNGNNYGADVTIEDSVINDTNSLGAGVFLSGSAAWAAEKMNVLKISSSTISAKTPVEVKRGNVEVDAATLTSTASTTALQNNVSGGCSCGGYAIILTNCGTDTALEATVGTVTINSGNFTGAIGIKDAASATVVAGNTKEATITINGGYFTTNVSDYVVKGKVVVTSDKEGYPYTVGVKAEDTAEVEVAEPEVKVEIDTTGKTEAEVEAATEAAEEIAEKLQETNAVEICDDALTAVATEVANETSSEAKNAHVEELNDVLVNDVTAAEVEIAVQTYFDIKVADVEVTNTTVTEVTLNITPMYQLVATTTDVLSDPNTKIDTDTTDGDGANAVKIGNPVVMKIDKPVEITVTLPDAFKGQLVYVKHQAEKGVAIYKATADANSGKLTFTTKSGFSPFTFSTTQINAGASVTGGDDYADLQSALNYAGKNAEITVKVKNQSAVVSGEFSFTLKYEGEAKKENTTITAAPGYSVSENNGVYTVTKVTTGGYYPYYPSTTPDSELVKSPDTFDAGIALYVGVSVMGAIGTVVLGKKRED